MTKQKKVMEKKRGGPLGTPQDFINKVYENPYKSERIDMEDGRICIKYPIHISKDRLALLEKIVETMNTHLDQYIKQALYEKIECDLHSPQVVGKAFCDNLLEEWDMYKGEIVGGSDYRLLQYSTHT